MAQVKSNLWISRLFSPCAHSAWLFRIFVHTDEEATASCIERERDLYTHSAQDKLRRRHVAELLIHVCAPSILARCRLLCSCRTD
jgi:hypothetical protein